ncbi:hypothetical protein [Terribacillus sp. JSM ZJ617]
MLIQVLQEYARLHSTNQIPEHDGMALSNEPIFERKAYEVEV